MNISKEIILSKVSSYEILSYYLQPYYGKGSLIAGKNFSNPLISVQQETPSFNVFPDTATGVWRFKDFATGDSGSCFDLVMKLHNLSFQEALEKIYDELCQKKDVSKQPFQPIKVSEKIAAKDYEIVKKPFDAIDLAFWEKYGINEKTLERFKVSSLQEFSSVTKAGIKFKITCDNLSFAYENDDWVKLYKPMDEKKYKFQHLGTKEPGFIFGWKQLPENSNILIITGGEKDVMSLSARGYNAITLNSETATLDYQIAGQLKRRFDKIVVLYDNDKTGLKQSSILAETHGFHRLVLPEFQDGGKDISDYFSGGNTIEQLNELLSTTHQSEVFKEEDEKFMYNAVELMAMGNVEPSYLMEPIFPQKGTAVLAGKPDIGKSQFARQLCIQVALGLKDIIGFEINAIHNKSIYVATEDNEDSTRTSLNMQMNGLGEEVKENLRFMFAASMEQEEILKQLDKALTDEPADLVVVDSFGDIFTGNDSNNNMVMRNTVKLFDKIAKKHDCLLLFVHHINKGAYNSNPGQEHIQGGSGLVQKVRLAIILSEGVGDIRYFTVVKGNYCPKEYKQNSIELKFSEDTLLFTNTGKLIPTNELVTQSQSGKKQDSQKELENYAEVILENNSMSYGDFVKEFVEITNKGEATAKRAIKALTISEFIEKVEGKYRLKTNNAGDDDFEECEEVLS
ncbi:AAA family ATPase [Flavobacterium sp.]|jgi:KaiC/GvpD/RAD55 family RecA-like ATPase|uniref:AAA family ATPase n=1 Tax=Flavobacterium sp. TaxID=239 RepID=UPI0037BFBBC3